MNRKELKKELDNGKLTHTDIKTLLIYNEITIDDLISVLRDYVSTVKNIKEVIK
jgi:hypothetical protein